jgi:hypothetical protein
VSFAHLCLEFAQQVSHPVTWHIRTIGKYFFPAVNFFSTLKRGIVLNKVDFFSLQNGPVCLE